MSTLHLSVDRVDAHVFAHEARLLLHRSPGYLAVALVKGEEILQWVEKPPRLIGLSQVTPLSEDDLPAYPLQQLLELTLSSIKHLAQTLPKRGLDDEPISLSLSYHFPPSSRDLSTFHAQPYLDQYIRDIGEGSVYASELNDGLVLLFTREGELGERAQFWLSHHRSRLAQ